MNEAPSRRLSPALAFLANFAGVGLAYIYVGRLRQALLYIVAGLAVMSLASWSRILLTPTGFYITGGLLVSIALIPFVHCPSIAFRERRVARKNCNTWWFYAGWIIMSVIFGQIILELRPAAFGFNVFDLPSQSMSPTLQQGDYIVVDTWALEKSGPEFGDLYVFDIGDEQGTKYVKRIVGLPGDSVEIRNATFFRNGHAVDEPYVAVADSAAGMGKEFGPVTLGESEYFVLGDNRTRSRDSRFLGTLSVRV